ncbi:MAG: hypothetical protein WCF49_12875 [Xanthobacteraceae bacterium]
MANDEHVALLKQGVAAWNAWRNARRPELRTPMGWQNFATVVRYCQRGEGRFAQSSFATGRRASILFRR